MWARTFGLPDTNSPPYIVGISGFEPKSAESESAVLTIILYIPLCDLCNFNTYIPIFIVGPLGNDPRSHPYQGCILTS